MNTQEINKQAEISNELYTLLPVVLNVFLVSTEQRIVTVVAKNKDLNNEQVKYLESEYGKITYIAKGSAGFTKTVIHI